MAVKISFQQFGTALASCSEY